jgi:hypothetical protein
MIARTFFRLAPATSLTLLLCLTLTTNSQAAAPTIANLSPSFGTVGFTVVIYGTNFGATQGTSTVEFNGVAATVTTGNWSNTQITTTVPATATTGTVTVTVPGGSGGTGTSAGDFNVLATKGMLVLGAFAPQSASCGLSISGDNCITDFRKYVIPNVDGVALVTQWGDIESSNAMKTGSGGYTWTSMDNAINTYFGQTNWDATKKIGIILSPVTDGGLNSSTPEYVFSTTWATHVGASGPLDECTCTGYPGDGATGTTNTCWNISSGPATPDYAGFPLVFELPFYTALQNFYSAAVTHINSASYSSAVAYVRMGLAGGGEEYPFCSTNIKSYLGISSATFQSDWTGYANSMFVDESGLGSQLPLMAAPNGNGTNSGIPSDAYADTEAADAVAAGLNLGGEGLQSNDTFDTNCSVSGGSSNDWCYTFQKNDPPIRELQTLGYSDPSESTCTTDYLMAGNTDSENTGSLACLLPFIEGKANSVELYPNDMFAAYDPNYSGYIGSTYSTPIAHARAGD